MSIIHLVTLSPCHPVRQGGSMQPMRRESPYPMVPIDEARRIIAARVEPLGVEQIDICQGLQSNAAAVVGRVLAEDVYADEPLPDMPKAAVDGYALRAEDGLGPRHVLAELTAGGASGETIV